MIEVNEYVRTNKGNIGKVVEIRLGFNKDTQLYQNVYMLDNRLWTILEYIVKQNKEITKGLNLANQMLEEIREKEIKRILKE